MYCTIRKICPKEIRALQNMIQTELSSEQQSKLGKELNQRFRCDLSLFQRVLLFIFIVCLDEKSTI